MFKSHPSLKINPPSFQGTIVMHSLSTTPVGVYGFYPADGVVQMMHAVPTASFMPTNRSLSRVYMLGGGGPPVLSHQVLPGAAFQGALDVVRVADRTQGQVLCCDFVNALVAAICAHVL